MNCITYTYVQITDTSSKVKDKKPLPHLFKTLANIDEHIKMGQDFSVTTSLK